MRRPLWIVLLLALLVPAGSAGPLGVLDSASPISLYGEAFAGGTDLQLFHKSFANGSLSGTLYSGNIVQRDRHQDLCNPGAPPREETRTVASASADTPNPIYFEADYRALTVVDLGDEQRAAAGTVDATDSGVEGAPPAAYLGPNPFAVQPSADAPSFDEGNQYVEAFPTGAFLVIPDGTLEMPFSGTAVLEIGNLTLIQGGRKSVFSTDTTQEERDCSPNPVLPPVPTVSNVYHMLRIQADSAVLKVRQDSTERTLAFYERDEDQASDEDQACPAHPGGYWDRDSDESLDLAYEWCSLPATSYTADDLKGHVDGIARFSAATGTVATGSDSADVKDETVDLAGNLELTPAAIEEEGRRMRTDLGGAVFSVDSPAMPGSTKDEWVPYASGAAGGALLLGVALYSWPMLKWRFALLAAPLYARLKKDEILENPLRDDILQLVQDTPGISASELGRRVECGWGTLVYHLTVLERMQLVSSAREGRHKRFFAQGRINYSDKGAVGLLANPAARTILDAIRGAPGMIQKDLSERLNLSPGTVAWHVERLAAEGLVIKEDEGRTVRYYPSERLLQLTQRLAA